VECDWSTWTLLVAAGARPLVIVSAATMRRRSAVLDLSKPVKNCQVLSELPTSGRVHGP
jgi:hypothetical protein